MRSRPCKSPVFRLYHQENTGADACKSEAARLFFAQHSPVSVCVYRAARVGRRAFARFLEPARFAIVTLLKQSKAPARSSRRPHGRNAMKRWSAFATAMLFVGVAAFSYSQQASGQDDKGWVTLFDGKNLDHWTQIGDANWKLADGVVAADKGNGFLVSKDSYGDFQIRAEFWVDDEANSGIFIRCTDPAKVTAKNAYEVNIFDKRPDPSYGTGAIVDTAKAGTVLKAGGKWNVYEITAKGPRFDVTLNGTKTVDGATDSQHAKGPIALQYGAGVVKFRKVEIKPL
jgi:3-keto-disaccharide hydrolase